MKHPVQAIAHSGQGNVAALAVGPLIFLLSLDGNQTVHGPFDPVVLAQQQTEAEGREGKKGGYCPVRTLVFSPTGEYLVVGMDDKSLLVFTVLSSPSTPSNPSSPSAPTTYTLQPYSRRFLFKRASMCEVVNLKGQEQIMTADKSGDVYLFPLTEKIYQSPPQILKTPKASAAPAPSSIAERDEQRAAAAQKEPEHRPVFGHCSLLSALTLTEGNKFVVSADRDQHIRVSRFPDALLIERFLFGQQSFISALQTLPSPKGNVLVAAGNDENLLFFDWTNGVLLHRLSIRNKLLPHLVVPLLKRRKNKEVESISVLAIDRLCILQSPLSPKNLLVLVGFVVGCNAFFSLAIDLEGSVTDISLDQLIIHTLPAPVISVAEQFTADQEKYCDSLLLTFDVGHSSADGTSAVPYVASLSLDSPNTVGSLDHSIMPQVASALERDMTESESKELDLYSQINLLHKDLTEMEEESGDRDTVASAKKTKLRNIASELRQKAQKMQGSG